MTTWHTNITRTNYDPVLFMAWMRHKLIKSREEIELENNFPCQNGVLGTWTPPIPPPNPDKMAAILTDGISNAFSWMKSFVIW